MKKIIETDKQYPYQNMSLENMKGEVWKPLPGYEEYYEVSNMGRVKSLPRTYEKWVGTSWFGVFTIKEKILKQHCAVRLNKFKNEYCHKLSFTLSVNGISETMMTTRIIYETFVAPFDKEDFRIVVLHKDGNPFNNHSDNLYISTRQQMVQKTIREGRTNVLEILLNYKDTPEDKEKRVCKSRKIISQYDANGNYMQTFKSVKHAKIATGISTISSTVNGNQHTAGGFFWRFGDSKSKLDVKSIYALRHSNRSKVKEKSYRKVHQYTLDGKLVATFPFITKASEETGISFHSIYDVLRKRRKATKGFVWKYAD